MKYNLQEELDHKIKLIQELQKTWKKNSKVIILAHSIGSWIAKEIVKKLSPNFQPIVFMLFPFIAKSDNGLQVNFSHFLANRNYTKLALGSYKLFRKLPLSMIDSIIKLLYSHAGEKARSMIIDFFISENHILESIFFLANNEFEILTEEIDLDYFKSHTEKTILFYCQDDMWASVSQLETIKKEIPGISSELIPFVTHDFCVNTEQCQLVAEKIVEQLSKSSQF